MTEPSRDVEAGSSPATILLVDDNAGKRFALRAVLAPLGFPIVEADSGFAALRCLLVEDFAMILLDVCMPIMDGFATAALIRQRKRNEMTPIIFITAYSEDEIPSNDRYTGGAVDFMFAPVPPDELRSKVSAFAHLHERAADLARSARDVQTTADQLRLLTDAAPIGIFQTDAAGRYVYTNPRWTEVTGLTAGEALGAPWRTILRPDDRTALVGGPAAGGAPEGDLSHRFEAVAADGASRILLVTAKAIPDGAGGSAGWVGTLADVTAEVQAEAAMSEARDAALNSSAMQRNFTASASHELRTPTTSILGFVEEVLEDDALSEENRGYLLIVHRNAQRLSSLIDDLLILGQPEIGPTMMDVHPTDLRLLVEQVVASLSAAAERAGTALEIDAGDDGTTALVDPLRLEQALTNLIGNALKFTPDEGGRVTVGIRGRGERAEITVSDTGTGIHPADVANIFERFYRTKVAIDTAVKGSGLGLAIAKKMVEAQDGTISVSSALGVGSVFTITLPACAQEPAPA